MKLIFSIAKNEFRYLFYSPVAWFVLIVFLIQCALFYTGAIQGAANYQDVMIRNDPSFKGFMGSLVAAIYLKTEFFSGIIRNLYLFIPILTMGLISREVNNGTSSLLYSSPVSLRKIVLGKFLGIMLYNLLFVLITIIFLVTGFFSIQQPDYGPMFSAVLSFYLLVCAYSAIGLFLSCLSSYQIVSALGTFTVIFILGRIGELWQRYDFVRDLTYFLSLQNRTLKMLAGLVVSKDVIYFVLVTLMFVAFTLIRLSNNAEARPWYVRAGRYLIVISIVLATGYISSRPAITGYWDVTATQRNTIHPKTQQLLKQFGDSTIEITLYSNLLHSSISRGLPETRNADYLASLWEPYLRFKPDIRFNYVYYYDNDPSKDDSLLYRQFPGKSLEQIATENADAIDAGLSMFTSPEEMKKTIDLNPENYRLVMQLKYRGRTAYLRTFDDPLFWPDETNITAALNRILGTDMPEVLFVSGELERSAYKTGEREYGVHAAGKQGRGSLVNIGFDVDSLNLATQDIPEQLSALVLADPRMELGPVVMDKLRNYIGGGGNLMVSGEPGKQYVLNPLLTQLGVQLRNGQIVQPTFDETPDKVITYLTSKAGNLSQSLSWLNKADTYDTVDVLMPGATSIVYENDQGFRPDSLNSTFAGRTWLKAGPVVIDSILPPFNPMEGDLKPTAFTTSLKLTREINGKEQRILVNGDADFASAIRLMTNGFNYTFLVPCYSWLVNNQFPVYLPRTKDKDILLEIGAEAAGTQRIFFVWILPALLLLAGIVILVRRKRK